MKEETGIASGMSSCCRSEPVTGYCNFYIVLIQSSLLWVFQLLYCSDSILTLVGIEILYCSDSILTLVGIELLYCSDSILTFVGIETFILF